MRKRTIDFTEMKKKLLAMGGQSLGDVPDSEDSESFTGVPEELKGQSMMALLHARGYAAGSPVLSPEDSTTGISGMQMRLDAIFEPLQWEGISADFSEDGVVHITWNVLPNTMYSSQEFLGETDATLAIRVYVIPMGGPVSHATWNVSVSRGEAEITGVEADRIRVVLLLRRDGRELFLFATQRLEPQPHEESMATAVGM